MNNKGFTLIELLASVVILATILAIAVPSINNLSSSIKKKHLENKIKNIEIAASKYAFDTNEKLVFVDKLVSEGYMNSDDEDGNVFNDTNNTKLNCYLVEMKKVNNYYEATFKNDENYEKDGKCDESKLESLNGEIKIQVLQNNIEVENYHEWLNGDITLRAISDNLAIDCEKNKCLWTSSSGLYNDKLEITINIENSAVNTKYNFEYAVIDENNNINRYNASIILKIDNELPIIYEKDFIINKETNELVIKASDNNGSGIAGYYIEQNGTTCNKNMAYVENNTFKINNGNYLICVKDKVGNISNKNILIENLN